MGTPYVGECRLVGFNFAPVGYNLCDGSLQAISNLDTLFTLIGTTYGGDGQATFALPDLRGRVPVHQGAGFVIGQPGGLETVTLLNQQMPTHNHQLLAATSDAASNTPTGNLTAGGKTQSIYLDAGAVDTAMNPGMIGQVGNNQPHENMQPFLVMNWVISLFGIFPSQN